MGHADPCSSVFLAYAHVSISTKRWEHHPDPVTCFVAARVGLNQTLMRPTKTPVLQLLVYSIAAGAKLAYMPWE